MDLGYSAQFKPYSIQCNEDGLCLHLPMDNANDIAIMAVFSVISMAYLVWSACGLLGLTWREKAMAMVMAYLLLNVGTGPMTATLLDAQAYLLGLYRSIV